MANARGAMKMRCDVWRKVADENLVDDHGQTVVVDTKVISRLPCRIWVVREKDPIVNVETRGTVVVTYRGLTPKGTEIDIFDCIMNVTDRRGRELFGSGAVFRVNYDPILPGEFVGLYMERINE